MTSVQNRNESFLPKVAFQRPELNRILNVYGMLVRTGEARDYGIGMGKDRAVFAIYRHAAEQPTWRIEKVPALAKKQGAYVVYGSAGQTLKRGHELSAVLKVFDKKKFQVV